MKRPRADLYPYPASEMAVIENLFSKPERICDGCGAKGTRPCQKIAATCSGLGGKCFHIVQILDRWLCYYCANKGGIVESIDSVRI